MTCNARFFMHVLKATQRDNFKTEIAKTSITHAKNNDKMHIPPCRIGTKLAQAQGFFD